MVADQSLPLSKTILENALLGGSSTWRLLGGMLQHRSAAWLTAAPVPLGSMVNSRSSTARQHG